MTETELHAAMQKYFDQNLIKVLVHGFTPEGEKDTFKIISRRDNHYPIKPGGFNQSQMARLFDVHVNTIANWENGIGNPPTGYTRALRISGDLDALWKCFHAYEPVRRVRDALDSKHVLRNISEEQIFRERLKNII